jgi:hypothetical protein
VAAIASAEIGHLPGCHARIADTLGNRASCIRTGRAWAIRHRPQFHMTAFEVCVANHESGEPNDPYNPAHIDWRYSGDYEGAYNWTNETWLAQGGGRYAKHAYEATPEQQTLVFRAHANAQDWPNTVPACGG